MSNSFHKTVTKMVGKKDYVFSMIITTFIRFPGLRINDDIEAIFNMMNTGNPGKKILEVLFQSNFLLA